MIILKKNIKLVIHVYLLTNSMVIKPAEPHQSYIAKITNEITDFEITDLHFTPHLNTDHDQPRGDLHDLVINSQQRKTKIKPCCSPKFRCIIS